MFSLRNKENLPHFKAPLRNENSAMAIVACHSCGPSFGGLPSDLDISDNAASNTNSYTYFNFNYEAPPGVSDAQTILAGTNYFTPSEVEVFYFVKNRTPYTHWTNHCH